MLEETMIMMITGAKTVLEIKEWRPFIPKNKKENKDIAACMMLEIITILFGIVRGFGSSSHTPEACTRTGENSFLFRQFCLWLSCT